MAESCNCQSERVTSRKDATFFGANRDGKSQLSSWRKDMRASRRVRPQKSPVFFFPGNRRRRRRRRRRRSRPAPRPTPPTHPPPPRRRSRRRRPRLMQIKNFFPKKSFFSPLPPCVCLSVCLFVCPRVRARASKIRSHDAEDAWFERSAPASDSHRNGSHYYTKAPA